MMETVSKEQLAAWVLMMLEDEKSVRLFHVRQITLELLFIDLMDIINNK